MVDRRNHPSSDRARDPLGVLRRAVDDLHRAVDERSSLGSAGLEVQRYAGALLALARVLPAVEQELIRCGHGRLAMESLTPLLLDDVRSFGLDVEAADSRRLERYDDAGAWWGAAYVLHGSRLGATVIADRLASDLPEAPRRYFGAAATGAAPSWAAFRSAARRVFTSGQADVERAIAAARTVFEALLVEFDEVCRPSPDEGRVA